MLRTLSLVALLASAMASAKPWNGIIPGQSSQIDVIGKFGDPSKRMTAGGKEVLVYAKEKAIKGTVQAQFKFDASKIVERIDIYPSVVLDLDAIEQAYGPDCTAKPGAEPCYLRKETEMKRTYFQYVKLGLAVFFQDDGRTVRSMAFLPGS